MCSWWSLQDMSDGIVKVTVESCPPFGVLKYVFIFIIVGLMLAYSGSVTVNDGIDTDDG